MRSTDSVEQSGAVEGCDDPIDKVRRFMQEWSDRLTLDNLRLGERYLKVELLLLIRFVVGTENEQFVACFEREPRVSGPEKNRHLEVVRKRDRVVRDVPEALKYDSTKIDAPKTGTGRENGAVFPDIVQIVERPEQSPFPTRIWFDRVDSVYRILPHALYWSSLVGLESLQLASLRPVTIAVSPDGEVEVVGVRLRDTVNEEKLIGQVVKSAPQFVNDGPGPKSDRYRGVANTRDVINQLSCLRIALGPDFIRLRLKEVAKFNLKIQEMLVGPFGLVQDYGQSFIGCHRGSGEEAAS